MVQPVIGVIAQILPALLNVVLSAGHFNRSLMVNAIRDLSNQQLCGEFGKQNTHKDAAGKPDPFPCFRPGLAAMNVCQAATAIAISLAISSFVSPNSLVAIGELLVALFIFFLMFIFLTSFSGELFHLEDSLPKSRRRWVRWIGRHLGLNIGLMALLFSLLISLMPLVHFA
jgi:hypothetical protein